MLMMDPRQATVEAHIKDGVDLKEAKHLIIYVDDQSPIAETLGMLIVTIINPSTEGLPELPNLSFQFLQSSLLGGLEQTVRAVQGLIHQAPADCKIGIICDQDQKEFLGNQLASEIKARTSTPELASRIKIAAYTANAHMDIVTAKWQDLGVAFPKIETGIDTRTTITEMIKYLLHEN